MKSYLYLSLIPESLIASMLPPEEFGNYMAVGTKKRTHGEAVFFQVDQDFESDHFPLTDVDERCVPHPNGLPKCSLYLSVYRVLEHIPITALKNLYLVTDDGRVLELEKQEYAKTAKGELHLYQELCPVTPLIASHLNPVDFGQFVTDRRNTISVPRLAFVELMLGDLAKDPFSGSAENLPYSNIGHLRDCLNGILKNPEKHTKTVIRCMQRDILYRTIKNGFFVSDQKNICYYPFPSETELEEKYHDWWRSALTIGF